MSHSSDDYGDGASERVPEGVPLPRQAPLHSADDDEASDWSTDATSSDTGDARDTSGASDWATVTLRYPAPQPTGTTGTTGEAPGYPQPEYRRPVYPQPEYPQSEYPPAAHPQPEYRQPALTEQPTYYPPAQPTSDGYPSQAQPYAQPPADPYAAAPQPYPPAPPQGYAATHPAPAPQPAIQPAAQPEAPAPPQPVVAPRPEDLLVPNQSPAAIEPASWGWRGRMSRATGGLVKPKAGPDELRARQAIHDIQRSFSRPMTVVVVQPKGGAGKTPTTICLSAAFGAHRGGYVVGWDDNETRGTLAVRVVNPDDQRATVWDLLGDLAAFERFDARVGDLSYYVRSQPDAHFDALVSDDHPGNMSQIGEDEFQRLHKVLQRFYRMIVVDTGNNVRSPNWQAAVNAADLVVVVSSYQRDAGYSGSWVLDHLAQTGRAELARNAVTVLTAADPTTDKLVREQLLEHFRARTRSVIEIPYDRELAHGGPIRWNDLAAPTRNAWVLAGATIANCLGEHDQRALAARRG